MSRPHYGGISWVQMELYHLGELPEKEATHVERYLKTASTPDFMDVYIRNDTRPMPPLRFNKKKSKELSGLFRFGKPAFALTAAVCALFLLLVLYTQYQPDKRYESGSEIRVKGGKMALSVIGSRDNFLKEHPSGYKDGDLLKLSLTSSVQDVVMTEVIVQQGSEIYFPYGDLVEIRAGNRIPLPGAIRLTGTGTVNICVLIADPMPSRRMIRTQGLSKDLGQLACVRLNNHEEVD